MSQFPNRPPNALPGSEFIKQLMGQQTNRDEAIYSEVLMGNFPNFMRKLIPITISDKGNTLIYNVTPDFLCIGTDEDYVRAPLGAPAAQKIADAFGCVLPTPKMSDQIWHAATIKLAPAPLPANNKMTDTDVFYNHNQIIQNQMGNKAPGELVAGHKKDVVISNELLGKSDRLGIHGLHSEDGKPIQDGALSKHNSSYRDYSSGVRLIDKNATLNGKAVNLVTDVMKNDQYAYLISNEGTLKMVSYIDPKTNQPYKGDTVENAGTQNQVATNMNGRMQLLQRISDFLDNIKV